MLYRRMLGEEAWGRALQTHEQAYYYIDCKIKTFPVCKLTSAPALDEVNDKCCQTESIMRVDAGCQTDISMGDMEKDQLYLQNITEKLSSLKTKLLRIQISEDGFNENDKD